MQEKFLDFLHDACGFDKAEKTLLAVSGGLDSMAMVHFFLTAGLQFGIAHCNFGLRGADSDADEAFVRDYAASHGLDFFYVRFSASEMRGFPGESVQMTARRLRYQWLEEMRRCHGYGFIAVAHHLNDMTETIIYNLSKGCGIRGLHGILPRKGNIIRPLLFATRNALEAYAQKEKLHWRLDASNLEAKYARNRIRSEVIPALLGINPELENTMAANQQRFLDAEALYLFAVDTIAEKVMVKKTDDLMVLDIQLLRNYPAAATVLYELIRHWGFTPEQAAAVINPSRAPSGASFIGRRYHMQLHRDKAWIFSETSDGEQVFEISKGTDYFCTSEGELVIQYGLAAPEKFPHNTEIAWLDADRLDWPLRLRRWNQGDWFQPLGMGGKRKKIQDLFSDAGLSPWQKRKVWILETASLEICWVVGMRADERFRLKGQHANTVKFSFSKFKK